MQGYRAIVMPTMLMPYEAADWFSASEKVVVIINGKEVESHMSFFTTWMWDLLGRHPVANVPNGITSDSIPLGIQIVGNMFNDLIAFQLVAAWSQLALGFYQIQFPHFR